MYAIRSYYAPLHEWADGLLSLQNGKPVTAINHFEMGNLIYQTEQPLYLLPQEAEFAFFYVLSLLCQPSDVATKKLKKLSTYIKKTPGIENDSALSTMVFYGLQDVTKLKLYVITSYSIHYTKLYDRTSCRPGP